MQRLVLGGFGLLLLTASLAHAQPRSDEAPRLVVTISIDQFRQDFLHRFRSHFGERGFNLLLEQGAAFADAHYEHAATKTGAGHAVILSGAHANVNGIIANSWYDVATRREVYCVLDEDAPLVGVQGEGRSPRNFTGTTIGDVLKLASGGRSKVISVSSKDRAAVLMGGQLADAAYWRYDSLFVTSTYYRETLPGWVEAFNAERPVTSYHGHTWERLLPEAAYASVGPDDVAAERAEDGMGRTFPHAIDGGADRVTDAFLGAFEKSPFSNEVVAELAKRAITHEQLGQRDATDLIAVGFSANDKVGHAYGPHSHEVMDLTVRTDRVLEDLFAFIDEAVGLERTVIVLTADHGVAPLPEVIQHQNPRVEARRYDPGVVADAAEEALTQAFGRPQEAGSWLLFHDNPNLYLNPDVLEAHGAAAEDAERIVKKALARLPVVHRVWTRGELQQGNGHTAIDRAAQYSFDLQRTGHVFYVNKPYYLEDGDPDGTSHGTPWNYDTHVPLLWYGSGIQAGTYHGRASVADIAPTLSTLLGIEQPAGAQGRVLGEMME